MVEKEHKWNIVLWHSTFPNSGETYIFNLFHPFALDHVLSGKSSLKEKKNQKREYGLNRMIDQCYFQK